MERISFEKFMALIKKRTGFGPMVRNVFGIFLIMLFQLIGDAVCAAVALPIPGSIVGLSFLVLVLVKSKTASDCMRPAASRLIELIPLLLVPVCVPIMFLRLGSLDASILLSLGVGLSTLGGVGIVVVLLRLIWWQTPKAQGDHAHTA